MKPVCNALNAGNSYQREIRDHRGAALLPNLHPDYRLAVIANSHNTCNPNNYADDRAQLQFISWHGSFDSPSLTPLGAMERNNRRLRRWYTPSAVGYLGTSKRQRGKLILSYLVYPLLLAPSCLSSCLWTPKSSKSCFLWLWTTAYKILLSKGFIFVSSNA